ncbi:MAG: hypothetical protein IPN88_09075 [Bacteroidetes bacterium]|nr:hypothetical protein [Bacteroidota bacterium]
MNLRKIEPEDFNSFQAEIEKAKNSVERTLNLTWFMLMPDLKHPKRNLKAFIVLMGRMMEELIAICMKAIRFT